MKYGHLEGVINGAQAARPGECERMKYGHLERVPIKLTVKSPLYIGSGEKLAAKEFILDNERHIVHLPSMPDMVNALLSARQRSLPEQYIRFMTDPSKTRLADFLTRHGIPLNPPPAWVRYSIQAQPELAGMNGLLTFVKNAEGAAYIPGSSIKGALRTALIAARMDERMKNELWQELESTSPGRRASIVEQVMRTLDCKTDFKTGLPKKKQCRERPAAGAGNLGQLSLPAGGYDRMPPPLASR